MPPKKKKYIPNKADEKELQEFRDHLRMINEKTRTIVEKYRNGGTKIQGLGRKDLKDMESGTNESLKTEELLEYIRHYFPDSLLANGYDSAIIGVASGNDTGRVVYSIPKMIETCMKELAVDYDEALEWLEYNTFNAYVGELTPIYLDEMYAL